MTVGAFNTAHIQVAVAYHLYGKYLSMYLTKSLK